MCRQTLIPDRIQMCKQNTDSRHEDTELENDIELQTQGYHTIERALSYRHKDTELTQKKKFQKLVDPQKSTFMSFETKNKQTKYFFIFLFCFSFKNNRSTNVVFVNVF